MRAMHWAHHPHNPFNWPSGKKWMAMLTSCWVTFIVGLNATSITTAAEPISQEFNLGSGVFEFNFFAVTAWNSAAALVPLATLPLMDTYGMRNGYVVCPLHRPELLLTWTGGIHPVHHFSNTTGFGAQLCDSRGLSSYCRRVRRDTAELRRWSSVEHVSGP